MKKTMNDFDVSGKRVLVRLDLNVPLKDGVIQNTLRIDESLPTIKHLIANGARVLLCSHLGRPDGEPKPEFSLKPVCEYMSKVLNMNVKFCEEIVGERAIKMSEELKNGEVMLLENIRFRKEEEECDEQFSKDLASLADIFINDAFGTAHRKHSSTYGVAQHLESGMGLLMQKEVNALSETVEHPKRPFVAILGGAKVKDKIKVVKNLINKVDTLIIGGGMAYTFIKAMGGNIGTSILDEESIDFCKDVIRQACEKNVQLLLTIDCVTAKEFDENAEPVVLPNVDIPNDMMGLDIGPKTIKLFQDAISKAGTIVWNGTMGVAEFANFANGTKQIAQAIADNKKAISVIGGGDTASAVINMGFKNSFTHISTGGGASLKLLEGKMLDGIMALSEK